MRSPIRPLVVVAMLATFIVWLAPSSPAIAVNDLTVSVSAPGEQLAGDPTVVPISVTATNPVNGGQNGFNGSFVVLLPAGAQFDSGNVPPADAANTIDGRRALFFENIGDIQEGSSLTLDFNVRLPAGTFPVGTDVPIEVVVGASTDPRAVPDFDGRNGGFAGDADGTASGTANTLLVPIEIEKIPTVGAEDEMLRGVHDQQEVYTLTVTNNGQAPTNTVQVEDFVPAVFEFLGCGDVDNSSALEYPTAPTLDVDGVRSAPDPTNCPTPVLVEMVEVAGGVIVSSASGTTTGDPAADAAMADGVYTHVVWQLPNLTVDEVTELEYKVGIPLRANAYDATLFEPGGAAAATANLDNNTGPFTTEGNGAEQEARNWATVAGVFTGSTAPGFDPVTDTRDADDFAVSVEDLSIHKSVSVPDPVVQGISPTYTLQIETSEYRRLTDVVVTDTALGNGQCPQLGTGDAEAIGGFPGGDVTGECVGGTAPSSPFASIQENADGTWTLVWDSSTASFLADIAPNSDITMTFSATLRQNYQLDGESDAPINGVDSFSNDVDIEGDTNLEPGISDDPAVPTGTPIQDDSGTSFGAQSANLDKSVSKPIPVGTELDCDPATFVQTDPAGTPSPIEQAPYAYRIGDRVCFRLGVDFVGNLNFRNARVDDFLPEGMTFERFWGDPANSLGTGVDAGGTGNNEVVIDSVAIETAPNENAISWFLGAQDPDAVGGAFENDLFVSNGGVRFEIIFSAIVTQDPVQRTNADIKQNLQKFTVSNIGNDTISVRDSADFAVVQPNLSTAKAASVAVAVQGQPISYTSSVTNDFEATPGYADGFADDFAAATSVSSWDVLPDTITCADVSAVALSATGTTNCVDGIGPDGRSVIEFTIDRIDPQQTVDLTYDVTLPNGTAAGQALTNDLGVRQYAGTPGNDNDPTNDPTFIPSNNIDTSLEPSANVGDARSSATVTTPLPDLEKRQRSSFSDSNNDQNPTLADTGDEATIGEFVQYEIAGVTIPEGTTLYNASIADTLPAGLRFVSFDSVTLDDGSGTVTDLIASPGAFVLDQTGQDITLTFPADYTNPSTSGNDQVRILLTAVVEDNAGTTDPDTFSNSATLSFDNAAAGGDTFTVDSNLVDLDIVEPQLEVDIDKTLADGTIVDNPTCDDTRGNDTAGSDDPDGTPTDGCDVQPGDTLWQKIAVTNSGSSNAYDAVVETVVPAQMTPLDAPGGNPVADGGTVTGPSGSVGTWDEGSRTITWDPTTVPALAGPIEPSAAPIVVDFHAELDPSNALVDDQDFTTNVSVPEYYGLPVAERNADTPTYGDPGPSNPNDRGAVDPDQDTVEVHFPDITVDKVAVDDFSDARLGQPFRFELRITNSDATATAFDVDVVDVLPAGWSYDTGSATPSGPAVAAQTLTWTDVFDVAPTTTQTIAYTATPDAVALATIATTGYDGGTGPEAVPYTNTVDVAADDQTGSPANADGPFEDSDDQTVFIRRTDIEVDKSIDPIETDGDPTNGPYFFGSFVDYTINVVNNGPDDSTEVVVEDLFTNPPLLFDSVVSVGQGTYDPGTGVWNVGPMADGDSFDLVLRVRLTDLGSVTNVAEQTANDQFDGDSTPGNDVLAEDDQDEVTIEVTPTSLGDYVFLDLDGDGEQDPGEPGIPGVEIVITFPDPADPTVTRQYTTVTNSAGLYSLPPLFTDEISGTTVGTPALTDITVDIVEANSPNLDGLTATDGPGSDADGGADGVSIQQIIPGDPSTTILPDGTNARLDVDFGYEPTEQTLGDRVWWDQDNSADTTDGDPATATEFGLPGVTVTATWYGFDGMLGIADDLVFTTTTSDGTVDVDGDGNPDPSGAYLFQNIPAGQYDVAVDTTTLPNDLTDETYDFDGIASPSLAQNITLDPGEDQLDVDFSYIGPGEIGDTVWYDADGDGVQDLDEPGISGVGVDVIWFGPDGVEGTPDDVTTTVTTSDGTTDVDGDGIVDPAGTYFVDHLPTGDYRVTVDDSTLPGSMTPTADFDDPDPTTITTPNTSLTTLTAATPSDRDQDFGYTGDLDLGDMIWYDVLADGNPAPDPADGDIRIAGVPVTVTWAGNDGVFGTPDDYSTTVVTSDGTVDTNGDGTPEPLGDYLVSNLPDGDYRVDVDTAGVLTDLGLTTPTFDFDGGGDPTNVLTPNTSETTLAGADDLDQDFSYTGVGRIGDTIWFDADESGAQEAGEPGIGGVDVQLTWGGPDGVLGDDPTTPGIDESADDQVYTTTTSDGTVDVDGDGNPDPVGTYLFDRLPFGDYEVVVDPAGTTLPPGLEQVSDPDTTLDATSQVTLDATTPEDLDQDFGYNGVGSVGDTVWLDLDSDGAQDPADPTTGAPAEPGISGVDVEIRWVGGDGIAGTADDYVTTVTTSDGSQDVDGDGTIDPVGFYRVPELPHGDVIVTVDPTTGPLPDLVQTFDADGTGTANTSTVTLAADDAGTPNDEANDVEQDFGYVGQATLGDLVFYDRDANGTGVIDGLDTPIPGVTVDVTWGGFDGVIGDDPGTPEDESADDLLFSPTTDAAGNYLLSGLPPGVYSAVVDQTTLPAGIDTPTYDLDGIPDGDTTVTLGPTDDRRDVDFSFTGLAGVGDTIFVDLDGDGEQDPEEVGLAGVTVTATYLAPDGSTIAVSVQTSDGTQDVNGDGNPDPIGTYFIGNLPLDVPITITVDDTTLPPELVPSSDPDDTLDNTSTVTLTSTEPLNLDQDFGYNGPGRLGDTVFYDVDGAGGNVPDPATGDIGLPNVTVTAVWGGRDGIVGDDPATPGVDESLDDMTLTTTTSDGATDVDGDGNPDPAGTYLFENLPFGDYTITLDPTTLPGGTEPVFDPDGGADLASATTLDTGTPEDLDQDFSVTGTGTIGDTVWQDADADGVQDPGEAGVAGVDVTISYSDPITGATVSLTTTTSDGATDVDGDGNPDPAGTYLFENLPAGEYTISYAPATLPAGFGPASDPDDTLDAFATITLGDGEANLDIDFGVRPIANITGVVFEDLDGDGVQDPDEPGIPGVSVEITDETGQTITVVTDADGTYDADDLLAGDIAIDVVDDTVPDGVQLTTGNDPHTFTAPAGETTPAEPIGYAPLTFISGTIWYDQDAAGDLDTGELRLAGIVVELLDADGDVIASATTDGAGFYDFTDIPTGEYSVRVDESTLPTGLDRQTFDPDGTLDGTHPITLTTEGSPDNDFGYTGTGSISDTVWVDTNRNGRPDGGEQRAQGVRLTVTWAGPDGVLGTADDVIQTAVSDANGNLSVPNLPAGVYRIDIDTSTLPPGLRLVGSPSVTIRLAPGQSLDLDSFPLQTAAIPRTGSTPLPWVLIAALAIAVGTLLLGAARRRTTA